MTMMSETDIDTQETDSEPSLVDRVNGAAHKTAQELHKAAWIYALFGALDGVSLANSTIRYLFDVIYTNNPDVQSGDAMHHWMMSPTGFIVTALESIAIIACSIIANQVDSKSKGGYKQFIALIWPYVRDAMKASKNGLRGVRSLIQIANALGHVNINFLILPLGLALGLLAICNRIAYRYMKDERKKMSDANAVCLAEIEAKTQAGEVLTEDERRAYYKEKIQQQAGWKRAACYATAFTGGFLDSMYLYLGVLGLGTLAGPAFIPMAVFCFVQSVFCIMSRVYEEYTYQRNLEINAAEIDLALYLNYKGPWITATFARLEELSKTLADKSLDENVRATLQAKSSKLGLKLKGAIDEFTNKRNRLQSLQTLSYTEAFFAGIKNGLAAYSAYNSAIFFVSTILLIASATFPPALLITGVSLGIGFIAGFIVASLIQAHRHQAEQEKKQQASPDNKLLGMMAALKEPGLMHVEQPEPVDSILGDGLVVDPSPHFFFQEWCEVVRTCFSGLGKGIKSVDFTMNYLQRTDVEGHAHDTMLMQCLSIVPSLLYAVVLPMFALVKGFKKTPEKKKQEERPNPPEQGASVATHTAPVKSRPGLPHSSSLPSINRSSFFSSPGRCPTRSETPAIYQTTVLSTTL